MTSVFRKSMMGLALASTVAMAATPADAQRFNRGSNHRGFNRGFHRGNGAGIAIGAGLLGLGVGAAIASSNRGYYDRGYYDQGYYGDPSGYDYGYRCTVRRHWDPYWGRWVRVRYC
jgi:hypothetical protein